MDDVDNLVRVYTFVKTALQRMNGVSTDIGEESRDTIINSLDKAKKAIVNVLPTSLRKSLEDWEKQEKGDEI